MSDVQSFYAQHKADVVTGIIASAGIPAPLWMGYLDETAKVIGIVYSIVSVSWVLRQWFKK